VATIEKRERKAGTVYQADVRIRGFPRQKRTFKRLTDAKIWAQQTEASIRSGQFRDVHKTARTKKFEDLIEKYRDEVLAFKSEKTQKGEWYIVDRWEQELGGRTLSSIDASQINRILQSLRAEGDVRRAKAGVEPKPKSQRTMKYYRDTLAMLFKHAENWGWIGRNPMADVKQITNLSNQRVRFLDDEERVALLRACKASANRQLYPIVVFALSTGARKGEILGLTLDDVDLDRGVAIFRNTKNGETRSAPLVGHLKDVLEEQAAWAKEKHEAVDERQLKRWLFPSHDGQKAIDIRAPWEKARDQARIMDFRFHDLRHSTASYLAMNGASQLEIAEVLGHKTLQMVKRYSHLSDSHVKDLITRLDHSIF
jgi:integrase